MRGLSTRVVAPLTPTTRLKGKPIGRLNPVVDVEGKAYAVLLQEMAAIPVTALGAAAGSLRSRSDDLIAAVDLLFTGI